MALGGPGRLGTAFNDRSGTCSASIGTFVQAMAQNEGRGFARISNNNPAANLFVYDKAGGAPATATNTIKIVPGEAYVWDIKVPINAIQVGSDTASATFEGAEG